MHTSCWRGGGLPAAHRPSPPAPGVQPQTGDLESLSLPASVPPARPAARSLPEGDAVIGIYLLQQLGPSGPGGTAPCTLATAEEDCPREKARAALSTLPTSFPYAHSDGH